MSNLSIYANDVTITPLEDKALLRFRTILPSRPNAQEPPSATNMEYVVENDVSIVLDKNLAHQLARLIQETIL